MTTTWTGAGDGTSWDDPDNWDNGVPQSANDVVINQDGASVTYENSSDVTGLASVTIDNATLTQDLDTASTDALSTGTLSIGTVPPSTTNPSIYNLESGTLVATDAITIGENGGDGTVNQTGGLATVGVWYNGQILADNQSYNANAGLVTIGATGGVGTYYLGQTGQLNTSSWVGYPGGSSPPSPFDNTSDAPYLQIFGNTVIGQDFGSTGTFALAGDGSNLSENFVAATTNPNTGLGGNLVVGSSGDGTFTQTDNTTVYLDGSLAVGLNSGSVGQYTLTAGDSTTGGGSLSVGTDLTIGGGITTGDDVNTQAAPTGGTGTFVQDSGTVHTYGAVSIGLNGGTGTYTFTGGILNADSGLSAGTNGGTGTYTQTGGTATIGLPSSGSTLSLGAGPLSGSFGTLNLSTADDSNPGQLTVYGNIEDGQDTDTTGNIVIGTAAANGDPTNLSVDADTNGYGGDMTVGDAGNGNLTVYSGTLDVDYNINIGVNGTGTVTQYDGSTVTAGYVDMSIAAGSGTSNYTVNGGVLGVSDLNIGGGSSGPALFTQNGGIVNVQDDDGGLNVNNNNGGGSSYVMTAGALNVFNTMQIGAGGLSTFTQSGGTTTLGSDTTNSNVALTGAAALDVGQYLGDDGDYTFGTTDRTVPPPILTVDGAGIIGDSGAGSFDQDSGTVTVSSTLTIGNASSGNGAYTLSGGTLTVDSGVDGTVQADTIVAAAGNGNFINSGGDQTTDALVIGQQLGSTGFYQLTSGAELNIINSDGTAGNGFLDVGEYGGATFEQDGGTTTMTGSLDVGRYASGIGTVDLHGGSITVDTFADDGLSGSGSITQDSQDGASSLDVKGGDFNLGREGGSSGTYSMAGNSTLTVDTGSLNVGNSGMGIFTQAGSSNVSVVDGQLNIGLNAGASGAYTLNSGVLTVGSINVGAAGAGTFTQTGGGVNAMAGEIVGNNGATTASYTQTGGAANIYAATDAPNALVVGAGIDSGTNATYTLASTSQSAPAYLIVDQGGLEGGVDIGEDPGTTGNFTIGTEGLATDATSMTVEGTNPVMTVGDFGTGNLTIYSGTLDVETDLNIGVNGTGTVIQDGGLVEPGSVEMSSYVGDGTSSYTISGGTLFTGDLYVGPAGLASTTTGTATFTQEGSSNVELYDLNINHLANSSTSTYTLSGGTLTAALEDVGSSGTGKFSQSGGNNELTQTLTIGTGGEYDFSGGTLSAQSIMDDGTLVVSGTNTIDSNISGSGAGTLELTSGAALTVNSTIASTDIVFEPDAETLSVADQSGTLGTISGFAVGDTINLMNQDFTSADHVNYDTSSGVLTITNATSTVLATLDFTGSYTPSEFQAIGTAISLICFYPGTHVLTPTDEVAVETLSIGDMVTTHDGAVKPVRWIGRQTVSRVFADPLRVLPIRIKTGALGENLPCRDLLVSPDHALLVDGVLIQAGALVNGVSIVREAKVPQTFTYYHVELDDHSLILAENTPAETFIDNVDRLAFDNWAEHEALYPDGKSIVEMPYPRAKAYRQVPRSIRERLAARGTILISEDAATS